MRFKPRGTTPFFIIFIVFMIMLLFLGIIIDEVMMPSVIAVSEMKIQKIAGESIDRAVYKSLNELNIKSDDFFIADTENGMFLSDTVLINNFCLNVNTNIRNEFEKLENEVIPVPMGTALGIGALAAYGPEIKFKIRPYGDALTDCETEVASSGINQTVIRIWLNTEAAVQVFHPLTDKRVYVKRKILLVNTVIKGDVPGGYMGFMGQTP